MAQSKIPVSLFTLKILKAYPDRELRITDLHELSEGQFNVNNLAQALRRLHTAGNVVKTIDEDHAVWWAIATEARDKRGR